MILTYDLITFFIGLELFSLSTYLLVLLKKNKETSIAGIIYILLGGISSCFILLGIAEIYKNIGLTDLEVIKNILKFEKNIVFYG